MTGKIPGEVVELSGVADTVFAIDRVELRDGPTLRSIGKILGICGDVRRRRFDLVVDLHSLPETNMLAFISGAPKRLLASRESRSIDRLNNYRPKPAAEDKSKHLTERYFDVLQPLGIGSQASGFTFPSNDETVSQMRQTYFADPEGRYVGLFPGAGHPSRCWPLDRFAELSRHLIGYDLHPLIFLGPEEAGLGQQVTQAFPSGIRVIEGLSISQFIACAAQLSAFVTNDTGPMHLAACSGTPIVLILDQAAPLTYLPLTRQVTVVQEGPVRTIPVDRVFHAVTDILQGQQVAEK